MPFEHQSLKKIGLFSILIQTHSYDDLVWQKFYASQNYKVGPKPQGGYQFITSKSLVRRAHTSQYCNAISAF